MPLTESRLKFDRRDHRMDALPEGIAIETVMGCNLRCPMCAVPNPETEMNGRKVTFMPKARFQKIIDQISDRPRGVMLSLMGESLLHPNIVEFVAITKKAGHHAAMITNGTRLTRETSVALIEAGLNHLFVSVDGMTKATYEKQRIGGHYETVRRNVDDLLAANTERGNPMRIDLNYVVSVGTAPEKEAFYRAFSERVHTINFMRVTDWGGQLAIPEGLGTPVRNPGKERVVCFALWGTMFISAEGRAMLCCPDFRQESQLSTVDEKPLLDIWQTEVQEHRRRHVNDDFESRPCSTCHLNRVDVRIPSRTRAGMLRNQGFEQLWRRMLPGRFLPAAVLAARDRKDVPFGHIDIPIAGSEISAIVDVLGWALPKQGFQIDHVDVHVDGAFKGRAEWGFPRADVGEMFPGDGHSFCAFSYVLDTRTLSDGPHTIEVVVVDNASRSVTLEARRVTVANASVPQRTIPTAAPSPG
jgi:MoaA/NifB/PqqE/SkfB family radical SAM enzyme